LSNFTFEEKCHRYVEVNGEELVIGFRSTRLIGSEVQLGAVARFYCDENGGMFVSQSPFHVECDKPCETIVSLGDPRSLTVHVIGNATVDFLKWATVGDGCGGKRFHF